MFEDILTQIIMINKTQKQMRDNLFNANSRGRMIRQYGMSEAQYITLEELLEEINSKLPSPNAIGQKG